MLKDKVAIITGGTRGIGLETAKVFLENNAKVAILGSKEETVNNAIKNLLEINPNYQVIGFHPNLTNESELKETFQKIKEHFVNLLFSYLIEEVAYDINSGWSTKIASCTFENLLKQSV